MGESPLSATLVYQSNGSGHDSPPNTVVGDNFLGGNDGVSVVLGRRFRFRRYVHAGPQEEPVRWRSGVMEVMSGVPFRRESIFVGERTDDCEQELFSFVMI